MSEGFYIDARYEEQMSLLTDAQAGVLMKALLLYVNEKPIPEMDGMTAIIFTCMRHEIDYEKQKKQMLSLVRKEAGKKGGRPSKSLINKGNKAKKPNAFFGFCKDFPLIGKESTKEKDYIPIQTRKKEKNFINKINKNTACSYTHEDEVDFSSFSDDELLAWGEGLNTDFEDEQSTKLFFEWNAEIERRKPNAWEGKTIYDDGIERLKSHEEIMQEYGVSSSLKSALRGFLKHCYVNGNLVTNDRFEGIIARLADVFGNDESMKCDCVYKAINGGFFDIGIR